MDIQAYSWKDVHLDALASFSYSVRQQEKRLAADSSFDSFLKSLEEMATNSQIIPIIAYSNDQIVGWMAVYTGFGKIAFIGKWHPIVRAGSDQDTIAKELLQVSIDFVRREHFERLEIELIGINAQTEIWYQKQKKWYEALGMYIATEEARIERTLDISSLPKPSFPSSFLTKSITEVSNQELRSPFFIMFDNANDRIWLDQTEDQKQITYEYWLNRDRPFVHEASHVLFKEDKIVGLTVVRPEEGISKLGPIGLLPSFRKKGLGCKLMKLSLHGAAQSGFTKMHLEYDVTNQPAQKLYSSLGFHQIARQVYYALKL